MVYSAEEERLWNLVQVNCLDFNAWTLLIEETEKVAEVFLLCNLSSLDVKHSMCVFFKFFLMNLIQEILSIFELVVS